MRVLFVADVFGAPGRRALEERLPGLREELDVGFCVVNAENAAEGRGLTAPLVEAARAQAHVVIVDFHAEATSEKIALARLLDGRVTAVIGTHTHVQTADARVQPGGTAAITDAGMTGPHDSVIGVEAALAIERMRTGFPVRFHPATGDVRIEGALVECDADGRALSCETVRVPLD